MGKMRIEKAASYTPSIASESVRYSSASAMPSHNVGRPVGTAHAGDHTAFEFGMKRASNTNKSKSHSHSKRRRRREFTWVDIIRVKISHMFGAVNDKMPGPDAPLPAHMLHSIPRSTSARPQSVM